MTGTLIGEAFVDDASRDVAVTISSVTNPDVVVSAALFVPGDVGREFYVSGSGIPADTRIIAYIDASNVQISNAATASGARTATIDSHVRLNVNQGTDHPVSAPLDPVLVVGPVTTGTTGLLGIVLTAAIKALPATSADNYLEWSILDENDDILLPNHPGGEGRRVNLHYGGEHIAKFEARLALLPNTTYTELRWGAAGGNQVDGVGGGGTHGWATYLGGRHGVATMEVWDLDDGTGPRLVAAGPAALELAGVTPSATPGELTVTPTPMALGLAGVTPTVTSIFTATAGPAALEIAGVTPTIVLEGQVDAGPAALTLAGITPTLDVTEVFTLGPAHLDLVGVTPIVATAIAARRARGVPAHTRARGRS